MEGDNRVSRLTYAKINNFRNMLRNSRTLTYHQKSTLWGQARSGDLEGAMKGFRKLVDVRREE